MPGRSSRLLVVDDNPRMRTVLSRALRQAGYEVHEAHDGPEAIERLYVESYHCLIADCQMPLMSGLQLLHVSIVLWPHLPVVLMSGTDFCPEALARGAVGWIRKPFDPKDLLGMIEKLVRGRSPTEQSVPP